LENIIFNGTRPLPLGNEDGRFSIGSSKDLWAGGERRNAQRVTWTGKGQFHDTKKRNEPKTTRGGRRPGKK